MNGARESTLEHQAGKGQTMEMPEQLKECVRLWNLNCTTPAQEAQRIISRPNDNSRTRDDESWDCIVAQATCFANALGRGMARVNFQFLPAGTDFRYYCNPELTREPLPEFLSNMPAASHQFMQTRIAGFRSTAHGRELYDNAPEGAKRFYARNTNCRSFYDIYREMDDASWDYVIAHAETDHLKEDFADIRKHMQGRDEGTNMFWWRGRHRPKNKDSFDRAKMKEIVDELSLAIIGKDGGEEGFVERLGGLSREELRKRGLVALADLCECRRTFFCGKLFWDLHYWDEASRNRFLSVAREMAAEDRLGRLKAVMSAETDRPGEPQGKEGAR